MARTRRSGIPAAQWFYAQSFHGAPVRHVTLVPVPHADPAVVEVAIIPLDDEQDDREEDCGARCGSACGYCGRCS